MLLLDVVYHPVTPVLIKKKKKKNAKAWLDLEQDMAEYFGIEVQFKLYIKWLLLYPVRKMSVNIEESCNQLSERKPFWNYASNLPINQCWDWKFYWECWSLEIWIESDLWYQPNMQTLWKDTSLSSSNHAYSKPIQRENGNHSEESERKIHPEYGQLVHFA